MNENLNPQPGVNADAGSLSRTEETMRAIQNASTGTSIFRMFDYQTAFNELSETKRNEYRERGKTIDVFNARSIMEFGQDASKEVSSVCSTVLNRAHTNNKDELTQLTNELVAAFQDNRLPGEKAKATSWLEYIPFIGKRLAKTAQNEIIERKTDGEKIKEISQKFVAMKSISMTNTGILEDIAKKIQMSINMSHEDVMTLMMKLEDVQNDLNMMESNPNVQLEALQATRMAERRLKRQISNMGSMEYVLTQAMLNVGVQMSNNDDIIEIADMSITYLIPIFELQCAIGSTGRDAEKSAELETLVKEFANNALVANARSLAETATKLTELTEGTIYQPDKIREAQNIYVKMITDIKRMRDAGDQNYDEMQKQLVDMAREFEKVAREG